MAQAQTSDRLLLEAEEAAALLGITPRQLRKMVRAREIPAVRVGRWVKFRRETLEQWVADREKVA